MAQRFNVSIPDELAARIEHYKHQLSFSAFIQKSLESELVAAVIWNQGPQAVVQLARKAGFAQLLQERNDLLAGQLP